LLKLEETSITHAAGNVKQNSDIKWDLIGISDLCNLLRSPFFVEAKIRKLQIEDRLSPCIDDGYRHHHQT
jgi:hypothetical protein